MRTNLPVTNIEHELKDGAFIVSRTDLKGRITYVNRAFVEMSGYIESELIGAPHNLVRHPDMPPEAFKDLWDTLKIGKPWSGYVKNRCKNGDYYWVLANATPTWENGSINGYMSVRTRPERATVEAVARIYRQFVDGKARGLAIREGKVVKTGILASIGNRLDLGVKGRLAALIGVMATSMLVVWRLGVYDLAGAAGIAGVLGLAFASQLAFSIYATVVTPLQRMGGQMLEISQGNMSLTVQKERNDEIGELADSFRSMFIKLGFDVAEAYRQAEEMSRIKVALDNVSANVMMADNERNIVYVNKAVLDMFRKAEGDIRRQLPQFDVSRLLGGSIDTFHKNPQHQAQLLAKLSSTYKSTLNIGGRTMVVIANPVINEKGERLGAVVEWADRTAEVAVEQEVAEIVEAAANGDFTQRIDVGGKEGFFKNLAEGINRFLGVTEDGLNDVVAMLGLLAEGDLSRHMAGIYKGTFEQLKQDANATVDKLRDIVDSIRVSTASINTAAGEIAAGNADLATRTESQAASIEQTAASMEELTSTVKHNAENSRLARQLAVGATEVAIQGGDVVKEVVQTMGTIADSSKKIADITGVIDGIAFQTNILALNAAVEAARAGEQGRGFAVVAGEVRNLAQRSAAAAKEIKELIQDSVDKVQNGHQLVTRAGDTMKHVVESIRKVSDIMTEISSASNEQSTGIEQVNIAMVQMDEATQQNAALVEEAAAAAKSMEDQASRLVDTVGIFRLDDRHQGWDGKSERRGPDRAANVERLPALRTRFGSARSSAQRAAEPAGDDDGWDVF